MPILRTCRCTWAASPPLKAHETCSRHQCRRYEYSWYVSYSALFLPFTSYFLLSTFYFLEVPKAYYGWRWCETSSSILIASARRSKSAMLRTGSMAPGTRFVALRAGANLVGNTLPGSRPQARARRWRLGWRISVADLGAGVRDLDAGVESGGAPRHRETLYSLSVVRLLTAGGLQPYMLGGLTLLSADAGELQVQVGVGAQFPVRRRFAVCPSTCAVTAAARR